jgi:hypothetical protein
LDEDEIWDIEDGSEGEISLFYTFLHEVLKSMLSFHFHYNLSLSGGSLARLEPLTSFGQHHVSLLHDERYRPKMQIAV